MKNRSFYSAKLSPFQWRQSSVQCANPYEGKSSWRRRSFANSSMIFGPNLIRISPLQSRQTGTLYSTIRTELTKFLPDEQRWRIRNWAVALHSASTSNTGIRDERYSGVSQVSLDSDPRSDIFQNVKMQRARGYISMPPKYATDVSLITVP